MPANGRDIAVFVVGLAVAGMAPILAFPTLEFSPMLAQVSALAGGVPLHHVGVVVLVALVAAAWVDTGLSDGPNEREHWD
ncbi:hypothetical protein [Halorientalis regularis]|jgi:hypothetical protein|uniref:Uncharacterized protein n=1 Tax=Halorientalis regularis TaxID=660518 RepID=A0A1G7FY13_9EURY|nr:hypothetical protein [Halorientalis regularis]SDE80740.1 hypothetical protein SAMN05216218_101401 [Halorientalis regularis]